MGSGFYAACSGLLARMQALDVTANNLANVNTSGYKSENKFYGALTASLSQTPVLLSPVNQAINRFGILGGDFVNFREGSLQPTGNPTDLAIENSGFFVVKTSVGIRFTRNGSFHLDSKGTLVDSNDNTVLGQGGKISVTGLGKLGPITIPPGTVAVSKDGTISVAGSMAGRIVLADFAPGTPAIPEGALYFDAPAGSARPIANPSIQQGNLESSNMDPVSGAIDLVDIQRSADLMMKAIGIFNNDFDKTAAELVARV